MQVPQILEQEIHTDLERARSVAGASFKRGGSTYDWVGTYSQETYDLARKRCQDLQASGYSTLLVQHSNGNFTIWQGAQEQSQLQTPQYQPVTTAKVVSQQSEPEQNTGEQPGDWVTLQISMLNILLVGYVGPVAKLICDRLLARGVDLETAIDEMTAKIPDPEDAQKFALDARHVSHASLARLQDLTVSYLGFAGVDASKKVFARSSTLTDAIAALAVQMPDTQSTNAFKQGAEDLLAEYCLD